MAFLRKNQSFNLPTEPGNERSSGNYETFSIKKVITF